jgi:hypothetical protein
MAVKQPYVDIFVTTDKLGRLRLEYVNPKPLDLDEQLKAAGFRDGSKIRVNLKQAQREWSDSQ